MTIGKLLTTGLITDNTQVIVRDGNFGVLAAGEWFTDRVLEYTDKEIENFTWQDDGKVYVDLKEAEE